MTTIKASEVNEAMNQEKNLEVAAKIIMLLTQSNKLTDIDAIAVLELISNTLYGTLKDNNVELVNDWE